MKKINVFTRSIVLISLFTFISVSAFLEGGQKDSALLTLDRIFSGREFSVESFGGVQWLEDSSGYTLLESSQTVERGRDIVKYDPATGKQDILVSADKFHREF